MDLSIIHRDYHKLAGSEVNIVGRVQTHRRGRRIGFLVVTDGTAFADLQVVYKDILPGYHALDKLKMGSVVEIEGEVRLTPDKAQSFEIAAHKIKVLDSVGDNYPLQKKEQSWEFLREHAHLRARTKVFQAIFKIRSQAAFLFHQYFQERGFIYLQTPIITSNDSEGGGETFTVTTRKDDSYHQDFFGKKAVLTVSGQLQAEALAQAFKKVYTFGPTFRAELSRTNRHAAEFWMIEPEVAFVGLQENITLIEDMLRVVTTQLEKKCRGELEYLAKALGANIAERLKTLTQAKFAQITYHQALELLKKAHHKGQNFQENNFDFGLDLTTEHERYLSEVVFKKPVFVTDYPRATKSFYMKQNSDLKTVAAVDLLVPGVGELVGGSEREADYQKILGALEEKKIDSQSLTWYLNLRQAGYYKSAGFGLGFERYLMYVTGVANIRDVSLYPRTMSNLNF